MTQYTITAPSAEELSTELSPIKAEATAVQVTDTASHEAALEFVKRIAVAERRVKDLFADSKKKAHETHKAITTAERTLLEPLTWARNLVARKAGDYEARMREEAERRRRELEAQARAEEEERRLAEAAALEEAGAHEEAAAVLEAPEEPAPVIHVEPETAKVSGVTTAFRYSAEVTNLRALVEFVAGRPEYLHLLKPDVPNLNRLAVSLRGELKIPGVRVNRTAHSRVSRG